MKPPNDKHAAAERIARLKAAIGDGPHGLSRRELDHHLRAVLVSIGDRVALGLLKAAA